MTPRRHYVLAVGIRGQTLHRKERKRGWHFCSEFDGDLMPACPFGCMLHINKRKHRELVKALEKDERRYQDHLCDLADAISY